MLPVYLWLLPRRCFNCRISASSPSAKEQAVLYKHRFYLAMPHAHTARTQLGTTMVLFPKNPCAGLCNFTPLLKRTAFASVYCSFCTEHFALQIWKKEI